MFYLRTNERGAKHGRRGTENREILTRKVCQFKSSFRPQGDRRWRFVLRLLLVSQKPEFR